MAAPAVVTAALESLAVAEDWAPAMEEAAGRMAEAVVLLDAAAAMVRVAEATVLVGVDWVEVAAEAMVDVEGDAVDAVAQVVREEPARVKGVRKARFLARSHL